MLRVLGELRWELIVLYDDVLLVIRISDETLTWIHKHYGITGVGRQEWRRAVFATGDGERFYSRNSDGSGSERSLGIGRLIGERRRSKFG